MPVVLRHVTAGTLPGCQPGRDRPGPWGVGLSRARGTGRKTRKNPPRRAGSSLGPGWGSRY